MPSSHPSRWILFLVFGALTAFGCVGTSDTGQQSETGSLAVDLVLADGIEINQVGWQITGNGMDMSGDINVSAPGSTASVEVFGLPPGEEDYTVTLTAESANEQVTCRGSADFNVEVGETTDVMVVLNCKLPRRLGAVRVNGEFNICAELIKAVVSPLQTSVGNDIDVSAQAVDQEGDPITFSWTGSGGSFADPSAAATTFTCEEVGNHQISISVTDNDDYCDMATWTIPVTCAPGDGGAGGAGGDGGGGAGGEAGAGGMGGEAGAGGAGGEAGAGGMGGEAGAGGAGGEAGAGGAGGEAGAGGAGGEAGAGGMGGQGGMGGSVDPCEGLDCSDGNECTDDVCTDGVCSNPPVMNDSMCDGNMGTCQMGVCVPNDPCEGLDCSDGDECTADVCVDGICSNPDQEPGATCSQDGGSVCDGSGTCVECISDAQCASGEACVDNVCESAANPVVCEQFNPAPAQTGQTCDGSAGQECICEKPEFIAVDCELLGNKAAIPLGSAVQQLGVAFGGVPVGTVPQDGVVLPAALVCGFLGVGFAQATVANSEIISRYTGGVSTISGATTTLTSFVDDGTQSPLLVSPHNPTIFQFSDACGDSCTGPLGSMTCEDGTTPCTPSTFQDVCPNAGTGPGLEIPILANAPGTFPPADPADLVVPLLPDVGATSVDIDLPYDGLAFNLPDVSGPGGTALGCIGGGPGCTLGPLCSDILRGSLLSPRVMYDANCSKIQFGGGLCSPFESFAQLGRICNGEGLEVDEFVAGDVPACCDDTADPFCTSAANVTSCCNALAADYPTATPAQLPQVWVN